MIQMIFGRICLDAFLRIPTSCMLWIGPFFAHFDFGVMTALAITGPNDSKDHDRIGQYFSCLERPGSSSMCITGPGTHLS